MSRKLVSIIALAVVLVLLTPTIAVGGHVSWGMHGFNASHTFSTTEQLPSTYAIDWKYDTGGGVCSTVTPLVYPGRYYVSQASGAVTCVDDQDGSLIWRSSVSNSQIVSNPVILGPYVLVNSYDGILHYLHAKNGSQVFSIDLGHVTTSSPVITKLFVFTLTDNGILSKYTKAGWFLHSVKDLGVDAKPFTNPVTGQESIAIATIDNRIICHDISHGSQLTRKWDKSITINSGSNALCATEMGLLAVDTDGVLHHISWDDGKDIWSLPLGEESLSGIIMDSGTAYLSTIGGDVFAVSIDDGYAIWKHSLNEDVSHSQLTLSAGKLYVATKLPAKHIHCLALSEGTHIWDKWLDAPVSCGVSAGKLNLFIIPSYGEGFCLSLSNGKTVDGWSCDMGGLSRNSPIASGGKIYVTMSDGTVRAVSMYSGEQLWVKNFNAQINNSPSTKDNKIIVTPNNKPVYCLDAENKGSIIWSNNLHAYINSASTIFGNTVFVGTWDGYIYAYDLMNGKIKRKYQTFGCIKTSPTVTQDGIFVSTNDGLFYKFHRINGNREWAYPAGIVKRTSSSANSLGYVASGSTLTSLKNVGYFKIIWEVDFDSEIVANTAISEEGIFVLTADGMLTCRDLKDGTIKHWDKQLTLDGRNKSIIHCYDRLCVLTGSSVHIILADSGKTIWSHNFGIDFSSCIYAESRLILTTSTGSMFSMSDTSLKRGSGTSINPPTVRATLSPPSKDELTNETLIHFAPNRLPVW